MMETSHGNSSENQIEPIALVGIGCRFPGGAHDVESFWELLKTGQDAIVDIPPDRWNVRRFYDPDASRPGKMYVKQGGFLQQRVDEFDALFFGIAPREAECIDPQQRLLLETSWEALEDAGIPYEALAGSNTGVFIGAFTLDHKLTQMGKMNRHHIGTHTAIGSTMTILSNRISYVLDLCGPSMSLDTACSSSLVAVHLACQAIWRGECDLAMAGGVNVMMRPEYPVAMCKGGFLAPDARSKSFDARANGYGRGEGAGVVVLKRMSAALRDGDAMYALIRGTGANQDGRTNGITVPNPKSQAALIQRVCAQYAINPHDIHYVEAHGTGTPVGDPLEAKALGTALGRRPDQEACMVGSVKAAIGHLEAAAGVAAVVKTALCLSHRQVPPQANLQTPNPDIPFAELGLKLPQQLEPLAPHAETVCAGVNSFGYGGTNAHVVLQSVPPVEPTPHPVNQSENVLCLPLSARSESALSDLAKAWLTRFSEDSTVSASDLGYSASCRRGHHNHRLAVTGASWAELRHQLQSFVEQGMGEWSASGKFDGDVGQHPVFVYTGMGPQWWAMGRELYQHEAVYRTTVDACDAVFQRIAGWSILEEMLKDEPDSRMADTTIAQPANFLIQVGLTALWRSRGIEPAAIIGHSVGEVSAAYVAGVLTLEEALLVSYHRSRIQKKAAGTGKMLAVTMSQEQCVNLLKERKGEVSIAAINSPTALTLAGDALALQTIQEQLAQRGEAGRFLQVEVPYHSPFMEPLKPEVRSALAGLKPTTPHTPLYSTVTGDRVTGVLYDAEYWCDNIREPVYFAKGVGSLLRDGHRIFLEIGPHPVLSTSIKECCRQHNVEPQTFTSLRRQKPERRMLALALAELYVAGCRIDWRRQYPTDARYVQKLPAYPWQREVYWNENAESKADRIGEALHPLLDRRVSDPRPTWESGVNSQVLPYLNDHQIDGLVVLPGAAYVEAGLAAFQQLNGRVACTLEQFQFHQALVANDKEAEQVVQVELDPANGAYSFYSRDGGEPSSWRLNASGQVLTTMEDSSEQMVDRAAIAQRCREAVNIERLYTDLAKRGLQYGPQFQTMTQLQRGTREVLARIELHPSLCADHEAYHVHPSLLDGCFQSLIVTLDDRDKFYMPVEIKRLRYYGKPGLALWCHGKLTRVSDQSIVGDLQLFDETGRVLVSVEGLRCRGLVSKKDDLLEQIQQWTYAWKWIPQPLLGQTAQTGSWLVFTDTQGLGDALCHELETHPANTVIRVPYKAIRPDEAQGDQVLNQDERDRLRAVVEQARTHNPVGIVYLWGVEGGVGHADPTGMTHTGIALHVLQLLADVFAETSARLYLVTQGAQIVTETDRAIQMAQTPLMGLARVAFNEYPALRCSLVDVTAGLSGVRALAHEVLTNDREDDVALRAAGRYVHRLERLAVDPERLEPHTAQCGETAAFQMQGQSQAGFHAIPMPSPNMGEVVVALEQVNLTGVVMNADESRDIPMGYFAVGTISAVAEDGGPWTVGEKVVVAIEGKPASQVVCPIARVFAVDAFHQVADSEVAAFTTSLVPAYYALRTLARLAPGEAVLIDAELGGAAIVAHTVARWLGARPYLYSATRHAEFVGGEPVIAIDEPEALVWLKETNKTHHIRAWVHGTRTHGATAIADLLAPDAQELVLTDTSAHEAIIGRLRSCTIVNAFTLAYTAPQLFGQVLEQVAQLVRSRRKYPLFAQVVSPAEGLAWVSTSNNEVSDRVVVLSLADRSMIEVVDDRRAKVFDSDATYLITGGFGGFGIETAQWLAQRGARHIVLVGRRGAADERAQAAVQSLEQQGVTVTAVAADIADDKQVARMLSRIAETCPPLKGIFHAAAVLDDAPISELDQERLTTVMNAKAVGAWNLHVLTQGCPLDCFVLFSSVSSLIGNARQANYVAANTFLDALAQYRHAVGLPAVSVNWGAIATGMAIERAEVAKHLELMGMFAITAEQALETWAAIRNIDQPQYGVMQCNWPRWQEFEPTGGNSPRFSKLMVGQEKQNLLTERCQAISALPENERAAAMSLAVAEQVAKVLRMPVAKIDVQHSLTQMGVDSLMSAELQTAIDRVFGVRISTLELMRCKSLVHVATMLMERTILATEVTEGDEGNQDPSLIDRMSALEIDILLDKILQEKETV